jgi:hypothetical protein
MAVKIAAYLLMIFAVVFVGYAVWFAQLWGFSPIIVMPLAFLALMICVVLYIIARVAKRLSMETK